MGLILNLESSSTVCSVALAKDGELIALKELNSGYTHAENLTVFIECVLKEAGIKPSDLDGVAVSKGPGSYTGLRIGVSTAKGICYGTNKPLIAVPTLLSLASQFGKLKSVIQKDFFLCPMLDARRMEVYCALYDHQLKEIEPVQAKIIDGRSFEEYLKNKRIYFFGDGSVKCRLELGNKPNAVFQDGVFPSAESMICFSEQAWKLKRFENLAYFEPCYLKDFVKIKG